MLESFFVSRGYLPKEEDILVHGWVERGFEGVKLLFTENFRLGLEKKAQLCVYVGGEVVVDLWGEVVDRSAKDMDNTKTFTPDTLVSVFSSTKCLTSIALAKLLSERGMNYDTKVAKY